MEQADSETAAFEVNQILQWALGNKYLVLAPEDEIDKADSDKAIEAAMRRVRGEPLQYIFGEWEFYGLPFKVGRGVLIPRPETELLVEEALKLLGKNDKVLDLCSGSGCVPIAIAKKKGCGCFGIEISDEAMEYFRLNIELNEVKGIVKALLGDALEPGEELLKELPGEFNVITANPPYLTAEEMETLQKEVRQEPDIALFGGKDGLDFYKVIFGVWKDRLSEDGRFLVEVGDRQAEAVAEIMENEGFRCETASDYGGIKRVVAGRKIS